MINFYCDLSLKHGGILYKYNDLNELSYFYYEIKTSKKVKSKTNIIDSEIDIDHLFKKITIILNENEYYENSLNARYFKNINLLINHINNFFNETIKNSKNIKIILEDYAYSSASNHLIQIGYFIESLKNFLTMKEYSIYSVPVISWQGYVFKKLKLTNKFRDKESNIKKINKILNYINEEHGILSKLNLENFKKQQTDDLFSCLSLLMFFEDKDKHNRKTKVIN